MNKNNIIGFILILAVLGVFSWYNQPTQEQIEAQRKQDSIATVLKEKADKDKKIAEITKKAQALAAAQGDTTALFYPSMNGVNKQVVLKNEKVELTLDTKGGIVKKAKILNFTDRNGAKDVTLFEGNDQNLNFMLAGKNTNIITSDLYFTPSGQTDSTVTMTAKAGNGGALILEYRLGRDYLMHISLRAEGLSGVFAPNYREVDIEWNENCRQQEKGFTFENRYATLTYKEKDGGTDNLSETSEKTD